MSRKTATIPASIDPPTIAASRMSEVLGELLLGGSRPGNHARLGNRERLLLDGNHIELEEIVGERASALRIAVQIFQYDLGLTGIVGQCNGVVEALLVCLFPGFGNLEIASVAFRGTPNSSVIDRRISRIWLRRLTTARWDAPYLLTNQPCEPRNRGRFGEALR